jgi:hypothetical protein
MKPIIQVFCYNEADTLGVALKSLPRQVEGFRFLPDRGRL